MQPNDLDFRPLPPDYRDWTAEDALSAVGCKDLDRVFRNIFASLTHPNPTPEIKTSEEVA